MINAAMSLRREALVCGPAMIVAADICAKRARPMITGPGVYYSGVLVVPAAGLGEPATE
jgi:hypothetical protein